MQDDGCDTHVRFGKVAAGEELDLRLGAPLTEVDGGMAGTLEVFHSGAWGSVCSATSFGDDYSPSTEVQSFHLHILTVSITLWGTPYVKCCVHYMPSPNRERSFILYV